MEPAMIKNAIVVMFDSLQFNYLGCYGNEWIKTPNMDRLAREGVLFENCYTESLPTVPCRRSMHTGRYSLPFSGWSPLNMEDTTIADLCWGRPIDTALIFDCPMYRQPKFGYTRGFDKVWFTHGHEMDHYFYETDSLIHLDPNDYISDSVREGAARQFGQGIIDAQIDEITSYLKQRQYWKSEEDRYVVKTMKKAVEYLEQVDRNKQFYLWIDSFDPHEPWDPPSVYLKQPCPYDPEWSGKQDFMPFVGDVEGLYSDEILHHIRMLYAELVTLCDKWLGYLMDAVRRLGFEENTLLYMVSDHGEPLGKGADGHGIMRKVRPWPYEELAHTPMIMRFPGCEAGKRVKAFVQSCDVAPTVCDWLGIGVHPSMDGKSLLPLAMGEVDSIRDYALAGYYGASWSIVTEKWSYIHWAKNDRNGMSFTQNFIDEVSKSSAYLTAGGGKGGERFMENVPKDTLEAKDVTPDSSTAYARHKAAATTDGEAQWTCTPGSTMSVPEIDELYDRTVDPFQLNNVITQYPGIAEDMYNRLMEIMDELKAKRS